MLEAKWRNKSARERKRHAVMDTGCVGGRTFQSSRALEHVCSGPGSISSSCEVKKRRGDLATGTGRKVFRESRWWGRLAVDQLVGSFIRCHSVLVLFFKSAYGCINHV